MPVCITCKKLSPSVEIRQCDDVLCNACEKKRVTTLEQEKRMTRMSSRNSSASLTSPLEPSAPPLEPDVAAPPGGANASGIDAQHDDHQQVATQGLHCMEQCKHMRYGTGDMIHRCFCFVWYHEDCIDDGSLADKDVSWWVCPTYYMMPTSIAVLPSIVTDMRDSLEQLVSSNTALVAEVNDLKSENVSLMAKIDTLASTSTSQCTHVESQSRLPNLLIGDSTIRDVACTDPVSLNVRARGGAKTGDILQAVRKMMSDSSADIFVHVSTKDCATKFPEEKISSNLHAIADEAKRVSATGHVSLSSITPRQRRSCSKGCSNKRKDEPYCRGKGMCFYM